MNALADLTAEVHQEALRESFPIDRAVYESVGRDPTIPILCAGSLGAAVCVLGRDLGRDEVAHQQPLIGAAGRLVRAGVLRAVTGRVPDAQDRTLQAALDHVVLTNTVPYKPPGNKAYSGAVKDRFRPFVARFLAVHWKGDIVITLGNEAFDWFAPFAPPGAAQAFWAREDRYEQSLTCSLEATHNGQNVRKTVSVRPLPHPSPLNARWYGKFPALLDQRLAGVYPPVQ